MVKQIEVDEDGHVICPRCGAHGATDTCTTKSGRDHKARLDAMEAYVTSMPMLRDGAR